jgi:hypothetical protein
LGRRDWQNFSNEYIQILDQKCTELNSEETNIIELKSISSVFRINLSIFRGDIRVGSSLTSINIRRLGYPPEGFITENRKIKWEFFVWDRIISQHRI